MKSTLFSRIMFATLALAFAASAFGASDSHKSSFADFRRHTSERHNAACGRIHRTVGRLRANGASKHHARQKSAGHRAGPGNCPRQQSQRHARERMEWRQGRARTEGAAICGQENLSATGNGISYSRDKGPFHQLNAFQTELCIQGSRQLLPCFAVPS